MPRWSDEVLPRAAALAFATIGAMLSYGSRADAVSPSQVADASVVTVPYLANATRPGDLDFSAALCTVSPDGDRMDCRFRQVFLTTSPLDARTCVITTNGYERTFRREGRTRWLSVDDPAGPCGVRETTTLDDGGGTRWTMTIRAEATQNPDEPRCRREAREPVTYGWQGVRRPLSCTSIQPGAIER